MVESYIVESLTAQIVDFSMESFSEMLQAREGQLDGDVFELLYTLGDFALFKELIISYKPVSRSVCVCVCMCVCVCVGGRPSHTAVRFRLAVADTSPPPIVLCQQLGEPRQPVRGAVGHTVGMCGGRGC